MVTCVCRLSSIILVVIDLKMGNIPVRVERLMSSFLPDRDSSQATEAEPECVRFCF